jgi:hypothetical protein
MGVRTFRHQQCTWETAQTLHFSSSCEAPPICAIDDDCDCDYWAPWYGLVRARSEIRPDFRSDCDTLAS